MARKRKRRGPRARAVLWTLAVASIVVGLLFSPVTAANKVKVVGARTSDEARIEHELQWLHNKPCLTINGPSVVEQILRRPDVKSAELSMSLFGTDELTVSYYEPVALVQGMNGVALTDGGFLCRIPDASKDLPMLQIDPEAMMPQFGLSADWEPLAVADVCKRAYTQGIIKNLSISVTPNGSVCLNSGVTGRVSLGDPDELDEKFNEIREILSAKPDLLSQGKDLVLIAPKKPVTRPLQGNPQ